MNIYEFMSGSPWLTFFLVVVIAECIIKSSKAIFRRQDKNDVTK